MVQMQGSSCTGGFGVSIQDLVLDGNNKAVDGVDNVNCQEHSYIKHVTIYRAMNIGISVGSGAQNSGPIQTLRLIPTELPRPHRPIVHTSRQAHAEFKK